MKQRHSLLITGIFCLFFGGLALISLLLPDRSFSEMENRNLRQRPQLTLNRVTSGRFMTEAEEYISDQMAFRDGWMALRALGERLTGKQELGGIYLGKEGTLISRVPDPDPALLEEHMGHLNGFVESVDVPVWFGLIPSAASVWADRLPAGAPTADEVGWIEELYRSARAEPIDLLSALEEHREEEIYYRTDHHWTSLGALYGANAILEGMGLEPLDPADYEEKTVTEDFYGTSYSASSAWWTEPDSITVYVPEEGKQVTSNFTGREEEGRLYAPEYLEVKNKYAYFLGGNQPLCVIRSEAEGEKLLVVRDSYADCLAPFLSERFSEVHLFDLRYNRLSLRDYVAENGIDRVLVLYSFANYIEDTNQFLLDRD